MQRTVVRWNSTLSLIDSILAQQNTIESALREREKENLLLEAEEVENLKDFCTIASFFKEATDNFQNDSAGIEIIIPICQLLENALRSLNLKKVQLQTPLKKHHFRRYFKDLRLLKSLP